MTMVFNGAELEEVRFNGVDCEKVYLNGTLVFEKSVGATITVSTMEPGRKWGSDNLGAIQFPPLGIVTQLSWEWDPYEGLGMFMLFCSDRSYNGRIRVTVGTQVRELNKDTSRAHWGIFQTPTQLDELPKSGTHALKIEAIP